MAGLIGGITVAFKQIMPDNKIDLRITELRVEVSLKFLHSDCIKIKLKVQTPAIKLTKRSSQPLSSLKIALFLIYVHFTLWSHQNEIAPHPLHGNYD